MLFTRLNPDEADILVLDDIKSVKNSYFNEKLPVRFLIHGWLDHGDGMLGQLGRKAYLQKGAFNVISLDWSVGADTPNYFKARSAIFQVGPFLAKFIDFLVEKTNISTSDIYLIGHSLGAHIAGIAGKTVTKLKIPVIYGLDPAGPMFFTWQPRERLDVHDAKYVEVLHTSYQGFGKPIGYADFYANGGKVQPGCNLLTSCSHMRSISYWSESINSETGFYGVPLEDNEAFDDTFDIERKAVMMGGEPGNLGKARGSYKLETHATYPYAMGPLEYSEEVTEQTRFS
ncbi:phospholipase A1-like isoform X2 [Culicoides brevitarsis]